MSLDEERVPLLKIDDASKKQYNEDNSLVNLSKAVDTAHARTEEATRAVNNAIESGSNAQTNRAETSQIWKTATELIKKAQENAEVAQTAATETAESLDMDSRQKSTADKVNTVRNAASVLHQLLEVTAKMSEKANELNAAAEVALICAMKATQIADETKKLANWMANPSLGTDSDAHVYEVEGNIRSFREELENELQLSWMENTGQAAISAVEATQQTVQERTPACDANNAAQLYLELARQTFFNQDGAFVRSVLGPTGSPNEQPTNQSNGSIKPLVISVGWMIAGFTLLLCMVAVSIAVELNANKYHEITNNCSCVFTVIRCLSVCSAIVSILILECFVLKRGDGSEVRRTNDRSLMLRKVPASVDHNSLQTPRLFSSLPSNLFVGTFVVFSVLHCLSIAIGTICSILHEIKEPNLGQEYAIVEGLTVLTFAATQTRFFFKYFDTAIHSRLRLSCILLFIIMAANIGVWFSTVNAELLQIRDKKKRFKHIRTYCFEAAEVETLEHILYPFTIEYCVMAALMSYTMISNLNCLGEFLNRLESISSSEEASEKISKLLKSYREPTDAQSLSYKPKIDFESLRSHAFTLMLGLLFVLFSIIVIAFVRFRKENDLQLKIGFFSFQLALNFVEFLGGTVLLFYIRPYRGQRISTTHLVDRILLWIGFFAILVGNINRVGPLAHSLSAPAANNNATNHSQDAAIVQLTTCFTSFLQSGLQVAVLELALLGGFTIDNRLQKKIPWFTRFCKTTYADENAERKAAIEFVYAILNLLILLNCAEWMLRAICFSIYFETNDEKDDLLLILLMPLQVFFRFHSAVFIYDLKGHIKFYKNASNAEPDGEMPVELDFDVVIRVFQKEATPATDEAGQTV